MMHENNKTGDGSLSYVKSKYNKRQRTVPCLIRADRKEPRLFLCVIRGLLIFMATFGTLGGLVSAFDIEYRMIRVALVLLFVSMAIALIYFNKVTFYIGYILLLTGFAWFSARYFLYVNSGFQAFLNISAKIYGSYFKLAALREATEIIADRYETVSMVMIFLGTVLALLLNISISAYMSLVMTFLITFLPLQVAFYVEREVPLPYLIMLLTVYISVMMLKRSGNFALPSKYGKEHVFETKEKKIRRSNHKTVHKYLVSGTGMISVVAFSAVIAAVFMTAMNGMLVKTANTDEITNSVKLATDEYVKTIAQGGLSALFNRYDSTGGLSRGRLGGIGTVSPDFQTDLIVRFVPYSAESIYLRTYVGKTYGDNRFWPGFSATETDQAKKTLNCLGQQVSETGWCDDDYVPVLAGSESEEPVVIDHYDQELDYNILSGSFSSIQIYDGMPAYSTLRFYSLDDTKQLGWEKYGKIWICNVGADASGDYLPYYSFSSDSSKIQEKKAYSEKWKKFSLSGKIIGTLNNNGFMAAYDLIDTRDTQKSYAPENYIEVYEGLYLPYQSSGYYQPNLTVSKEYENYVYGHYLQIPDEMRASLAKIANEAGIDETASEANSIRDKYDDAYFSFTSEILSDKYGLTDSEKEKALTLYSSLSFSYNVQEYIVYDYGNRGYAEALGEGADLCERAIYYLRTRAAIHQRNLESMGDNSYEEEWLKACEFVLDLIEAHRDKYPESTYAYAASDIDRDDYLQMQKLRLQVLAKLRSFYRNEFSYTLSPGRTPNGKDVIEYFLTQRRRGYCAHFASSACLLLRSVGIPARYVEGYVVKSDDISEGSIVDDDIANWKYGDYGFDGSAVVEAEISDASAHAWIEVYIDGYGWIPYEMTPPSDEDELGGGLLGFFAGIITGRQRQQDSRNNGSGSQTEDYSDGAGTVKSEKSVFDGLSFILIPLLWLVIIIIIIVICIFATRRLLYIMRLKKLERNGDYTAALLIRYRTLLKWLERKGFVTAENPTVREVFDELGRISESADPEAEMPDTCETSSERDNVIQSGMRQSEMIQSGMMLTKLAEVINSAAFANIKMDADSYEDAIGMMKSLRSSVRRK